MLLLVAFCYFYCYALVMMIKLWAFLCLLAIKNPKSSVLRSFPTNYNCISVCVLRTESTTLCWLNYDTTIKLNFIFRSQTKKRKLFDHKNWHKTCSLFIELCLGVWVSVTILHWSNVLGNENFNKNTVFLRTRVAPI